MEIGDISACIFHLGRRSRWVALLSRLHFNSRK